MKIITSPKQAERNLQGESLHLCDTLSDPGRIYYCDSLLFLLEGKKDNQMIVCDPFHPKVVNELIPKGRGPGEQIGTFFFGYDTQDRKVYAFDISLRQALTVHRDSVLQPLYKPMDSYKYNNIDVLGTDVLDDSTFIAVGFYDTFRVAQFNPSTGNVVKMGSSPDLKRPIDPIINQAYTGTIKVSPAQGKFVVACLHADQIEIFDLKEPNKQIFIKGPELFEPSYTVKQVGKYKVLAHDKDEKRSYLDLCVTDDRIYALYSGKNFYDKESSYTNIIRVFSWEGEYLYDYVLNKAICSFTFDQANQTFYGIASEPGAEIYKFKTT